MNIYDIVKRKDRCLQIRDGDLEPVVRRGEDGYLGVSFSPGARVGLLRAHEFNCLATFPRDFGWRLVTTDAETKPAFVISVVSSGGGDATTGSSGDVVYRWNGGDGNRFAPVMLTWPVSTGQRGSFDLELVNGSSVPVEVASSPVFNPRSAVAALIRGNGVEVGPGMNPFVKPAEGIEVTYVEALPMDEWRRTYHPGEQTPAVSEETWQRYIIGDAQQLDCCDEASLDFLFSSHVFEHLMNPLGVLENWSRKLKPDGVVICVVPDLRYCFDLRQPPSTPDDWLTEYTKRTWSLTSAKYDKWCRYTAPYNSPDDLIRRKYSIHAHYYTPATWRGLAEIAIGRGLFTRVFLNTSPNNKDFGFVLWK